MRLFIVISLICFIEIRCVRSLIDGLYCGRDNCYDVLDITRDATKQDVTKAYRALARKFHPDMAKTTADKEVFTEKFRAIANAYEILRDDETREDYDRMLDNPDEFVEIYFHYRNVDVIFFFYSSAFPDITHTIIVIIRTVMLRKLMFVSLFLFSSP